MDSKIYNTILTVVYVVLAVLVINWLIPLLFAFIGISIPEQIIKILDILIVLSGVWKLWLLWKN